MGYRTSDSESRITTSKCSQKRLRVRKPKSFRESQILGQRYGDRETKAIGGPSSYIFGELQANLVIGGRRVRAGFNSPSVWGSLKKSVLFPRGGER